MSETNKKYIVRASRLEGSISLSGAKNSALRLLVASILTPKKITLTSYPSSLLDAKVQVEMLEILGKTCDVSGDRIAISEAKKITGNLDWKGRSIRNTLLVLGALVARTGEGKVPLPGGCNIGERKYDLHEMILKAMGAEVWTENDFLCAKVKTCLKGAEIYLPFRSTGATENAIICGSLAKGTTRVWSPHIRPEILDLIAFLRKMGAKIKVHGLEHIEIEGVETLGGADYEVMADNVEALTWVVGAMITNGDVEIVNFPFDALEVPLAFLKGSGGQFYRNNQRLIVRGGGCYPFEISTGSFPGINSDMQPIFATLAMKAKGFSRIVDLRFPKRFDYTKELSKMGGSFEVVEGQLIIHGGAPLRGADVEALDLRGGVSLVLAGLIAEGETVIRAAWQIDRGYNNILNKLTSLGGDIHET